MNDYGSKDQVFFYIETFGLGLYRDMALTYNLTDWTIIPLANGCIGTLKSLGTDPSFHRR